MKQKNVCKIEENLDHLLYLKANFIFFQYTNSISMNNKQNTSI